MSNELDACLHGRGGGVVVTGVIEDLIRAATCACVIAEEGKCDVCLATIKEAKALLASNPSPEPVEDAEVREAVDYFDNFRHPYNIADSKFWQTIKAALLRSQAGQGRVVTADMMKQAAEAIGSRGRTLDSRDRLEMLNVLNSKLAQETMRLCALAWGAGYNQGKGAEPQTFEDWWASCFAAQEPREQ